MFRREALWLASMILLISCGPSKKSIFADKRTDHEKYADQIREAGLDRTYMGSLWFDAAQRGLLQPLSITLPYKEAGYFAPDKPSAASYVFTARRGDRISLFIEIKPDTIKPFFGELWRPAGTPGKAELIASIDSTRRIVHDVEEDGNYLVRVQPPLLESVEFTVTISTGPSLAFPVSDSGNPKLISFWSDPRDGGRRSHQGVDISAKFRTPAVASADGMVSRVMENRLGGKVVFMRPKGKNYSLYYAHLDSQTVATGQSVKAGQTLGLIGTTGNAKGTVPHLHFGIYGWGGAIDPLPFVDPRRKLPAEITAATDQIGKWIRTAANIRLALSPSEPDAADIELKRGTVIYVAGAAAGYLRVSLPDFREGYVTQKNISSKILDTKTADEPLRLLDRPLTTAPAVSTIAPNKKYEIVGEFGAFQLVRSGDQIGWLEAVEESTALSQPAVITSDGVVR